MTVTFIDKIALLYIKNKKLLYTRTRGKDTFYLPGGKREEGESDIETLLREIKEELNVDIIPASIQLYGTFQAQAHGKPAGTFVKMTCYTAEFTGTLQASSEIEELTRLGHRLVEKISPVDELISADLYAKGLII
jgi:8-oxo-dGTP pyrophosphatase MutT (NUDIX family)